MDCEIQWCQVVLKAARPDRITLIPIFAFSHQLELLFLLQRWINMVKEVLQNLIQRNAFVVA